jgi:hypothetical protein
MQVEDHMAPFHLKYQFLLSRLMLNPSKTFRPVQNMSISFWNIEGQQDSKDIRPFIYFVQKNLWLLCIIIRFLCSERVS